MGRHAASEGCFNPHTATAVRSGCLVLRSMLRMCSLVVSIPIPRVKLTSRLLSPSPSNATICVSRFVKKGNLGIAGHSVRVMEERNWTKTDRSGGRPCSRDCSDSMNSDPGLSRKTTS